jgi:hypothetical protein
VRQRWKRLDGSADGELRFCFEGLGDKLNVGVKGREVSKIPKFGGRSEGIKKKKNPKQALLVHACNPVYSGGRDQEDRCLKPALSNSS